MTWLVIRNKNQINQKNEIVAEDRSPELGAREKESRFTCGRIFKFSELSNLKTNYDRGNLDD